MTNPNQQHPTPPAWYPDPDPQNPGGQRWWDGTRWTEHARAAQAPVPPTAAQRNPYAQQNPYSQQAPNSSQQQNPYAQAAYRPVAAALYPPVAPGTPSLTAHVWILIGLPLLSAIAALFLDFDGYFRAVLTLGSSGGTITQGELSQFNSSVAPFVVTVALFDLLCFVVYGLTVMFSYFDYRTLARRGFAHPFHWAWSFLTPITYVIGRTVVVRRRGAQDGMWPIWGLVAAVVISIALAVIKLVLVLNYLAEAMSPFTTGFTS